MGWFVLTAIALIGIIACIIGLVNSDSETRFWSGTVFVIGLLVYGILTVFNGLVIVQTGEVKVPVFAGIQSGEPLQTGWDWIAPWKSTEAYSIRLSYIDIKADAQGDTNKFLAKGGIRLTGEVVFPFTINPKSIDEIFIKLGKSDKVDQLLTSAGQSALRDAGVSFTWEEAGITKRAEFEAQLDTSIRAIVSSKLRDLGLSDGAASAAFNFSTPIVKEMVPPERIAVANGELAAASVDLQRQTILTAIATQGALRREQEGKGVENFLKSLPTNVPLDQVASLIQAEAFYNQSQALQLAIEKDKLHDVNFSQIPVTAPVSTSK